MAGACKQSLPAAVHTPPPLSCCSKAGTPLATLVEFASLSSDIDEYVDVFHDGEV
jgi:hypothetical protein